MKHGALDSRRDLVCVGAAVSVLPAATSPTRPVFKDRHTPNALRVPTDQRTLRFGRAPNAADLKPATFEIA